MKQITLDFETYEREQDIEHSRGFRKGFQAACDTIRELISGDKNLMHFDGGDEDSAKYLDNLISALQSGPMPKKIRNPFRAKE